MGEAMAAVELFKLPLVIGAERMENIAAQDEAFDNKLLADHAAADAVARGAKDAGAARTYGTQTIARQKVAFANSGVDATVGTPAQVMESTRAESELDAQTLKNNAAREAWGFKKHGLKFQQQAALDNQRSSSRQIGTILNGVGNAASGFADGYAKNSKPRKGGK